MPDDIALDTLHDAQRKLQAALIADYGDESTATRDELWYFGDAYADLQTPANSTGHSKEVDMALDGVRAALRACMDAGVE